jgi:hypothetical protein
MTISDLRNDPVSVCQLPKLDVASSSPVARSLEVLNCYEVRSAWRPTVTGLFFVGTVDSRSAEELIEQLLAVDAEVLGPVRFHL